MANKRMFSLSIVDTDLFIEMPVTSRLLYYELGMRADDDGFVGNWKKILRMTNLSDDDMRILMAKKFIIPFESGVIVIRHFKLNNYLRKDRYTPTVYKNELNQLYIKNDIYELKNTEIEAMLPSGIPKVDTDKNRLDKSSIEKKENTKKEKQGNGIEPKNDSEFCKANNNGDGIEPKKTKSFCKPTVEEIQEYCNQRGNGIDANNFYDFYESKGWMIGKNKMKDWKACVRTWEKKRKENLKPSTKNTYQDNLTGQYGDLSQFYMN